MSKMYFLPFRPAFDSAGVTVPGSLHYFTLAGTNTPSAPFADVGLATALQNPLPASGIGYLPPVYLDPAISYRVRIYLPDAEVGVDTPLEEYDPYVPALVNTDILENLADTGGSDLLGFLQAGAGAEERTVQDKLRDVVSIKDFGAEVDGATDDATAAASAATAGPFTVPLGTLKTSAAPADFDMISYGTSFTGTAPLDAPYPAFDPGVIQAIQKGGQRNCIIGISHNNQPANTNVEPVGVTGYCRVDNGGNTGFGVYGRADLYGATGVATNEFNSFNFNADPNIANLPPNRAIGTTQPNPICVTVAAGGTHNSAIGVHVCKEGSQPRQFLTGYYMSPDAVVNYGIVLDALAASTHVPALVKHGVGAIGIQLQGVGTPVPANAALVYVDGNGATQWALKQNGSVVGQGLTSASGGIGYSTGAGGAVTQATSRTTGVTINKVCGQITLFSAAGSATWATFTVTNSTVAATDMIRLNQASGTDKYMLHVTHVGAGSFDVTFATTGGTTTEQPVFNFSVIKGSSS